MEEAVAGSDGRENEESEAGRFGSFIDAEGVERDRKRVGTRRSGWGRVRREIRGEEVGKIEKERDRDRERE